MVAFQTAGMVSRERATENYFAEAFSVVHPASCRRETARAKRGLEEKNSEFNAAVAQN